MAYDRLRRVYGHADLGRLEEAVRDLQRGPGDPGWTCSAGASSVVVSEAAARSKTSLATDSSCRFSELDDDGSCLSSSREVSSGGCLGKL